MKSSIKILLPTIGGILLFFTGFSQSISVSYGPAYTATKQVVPIVGGKKGGASDAQTTNVISLKYEHFLAKRPISLLMTYSKFNGYTFVFFEKGSATIPINQEIAGAGYNGVEVFRYDFGVAYNIARIKRKFYFAPNLSCGLQHSKPNGDEIYPFEISGPDIVETEPTSAETFKTFQIVPSIGFRIGFLFWKSIDIGLSFQGVLGFKPYQKMYLKYEYKGTPQPTAEFEANGTGLFVTLGVGYRFAKLIK